MAGYCEPSDLLMGSIPLPSYMSAEKMIDDARDEIDSYLGYAYKTPFDVTVETGTLARPARLLLKRINAHLATGRIILAVASPEENRNLHAYGWQLVSESIAALQAIAKGEIVLDGAELNEDAPAGEPATAPLINNLDPESNVEAFYNRLANPAYQYPIVESWTNPDRLVP